jgi:hypothetical protein
VVATAGIVALLAIGGIIAYRLTLSLRQGSTLARSSCLDNSPGRISRLTGPDPVSFEADAGQTYDARGQRFTDTQEGVNAGVLEPKYADNVCIVGPTLIGPLTSRFTWDSALKPDGIQWYRPAGRHELQGAWIARVNDALSPPKDPEITRNAYFVFRDIYAREIRDDALENDACLSGEIHDSLFDGVHMGFASRPGSGNLVQVGPNMPVVRISNTMLRLVCQTDVRADSSCAAGTSHAQWFKLANLSNPNKCVTSDGQLAPHYRLTDVILRADSVPSDGVSALALPAEGTYQNVTVLYTGPGTLPSMPPGVTVVTDTVRANQIWNTARDKWLAAHGCDAEGSNCSLLAR